MKLLAGLSLLLITISAGPTPEYQAGDQPDTPDSQTKQWKQNKNKNNVDEPAEAHKVPETKKNSTQTPTVNTNDKPAGNSTTAPEIHCSSLVSSIASSGITQNCTVHEDCMGACCKLTLLAHEMSYNFSVKPCESPSVQIEFNVTDIEGATIKKDYKTSDSVTIPKGNMSYAGIYETESSLDIVLEKVLDITHFRLDFGVHYRVLKKDPLKSLFTHTLIPMLTLQFSKDLCVIPTGDQDEKYFGVIPKEYVKDKTKLALVGTIVALAVVVLIGLIYFIVAKKRAEGNFYRTYVSTDENRHLTKGNDGFEPLDDSDID
ncbi:uncharacterized protein LOC134812722 isoform X2 [Bolinopsis microptera]|uniref:uncharacterized protein LOC134812722 isoform X2 n=1 Tax=Bolinopsis microptera TaxID=2820187 RepID=UPI0030795F12